MIAERLGEVQEGLREAALDGWLLFDFRGANPYVRRLAGVPDGGILTRRWFVYVPAKGEPHVTVHAIECGSFPAVDLPVRSYGTRTELVEAVEEALGDARRVAMEYSPDGNIPYVSRVDAGTIDLVRGLGVEVVSSADLLQLFLQWSNRQLVEHRRAAQALTEVKDTALKLAREHTTNATPLTEWELQQHMCGVLDRIGMIYEHAPIVAFGVTSRDPHYTPPVKGSRPLDTGPILLDLFCRVDAACAPYADITWMAHLGEPSTSFLETFNRVREARDAGVELIRRRRAEGEDVRGHEVDAAARSVLVAAGLEPYLLHRTGHSLGTDHVHGDAANFDGVETLDERLILPRLGFTVEPGVYRDDFGVRSEINVVTTDTTVEVTTAVQEAVDVL
jgi:Xaa-Pro aminopeptidase